MQHDIFISHPISQRPSLMSKSPLPLKILHKENISRQKNGATTATTVQSDEIAPLTDSRLKQTTHYLINNIACRRKRGRGRDHLAKKREEEGEQEQHPISIKKPDSRKQPSLISSTRKKGRYTHTSTQCGPILIEKEDIVDLI